MESINKKKTVNFKDTNKENKDIITKEDFSSSDEEINPNDDQEQDEQDEQDDDDALEDEEQKQKEEETAEELEYGEEGDVDHGSEDERCLYKFAKRNVSDEEEDEEEDIFDDNIKEVDLIVKDSERETKPILTKYERVRILGDRAKQLSLGAKPMLLNVDNMNPKDIARLELERGVIPFIIEKVLPDGKRERWKISELKIIN